MSTLTAWKFDEVDGAANALSKLESLGEQQLVEVYDAAVVTWEEGKKKPKTKQMNSTTGAGALDGTFWGFFFGILFFIPFIGALVGAAFGALTGSLVDVGIDDDFIKRVRQEVTPGSSALFVLTGNSVTERLAAAFDDTSAKLLASNETKLGEEHLKQVFEH